eukprot:CAMPEP_0181045824 /NCGR_PEP_ID=MMETSP1070-20121207/14017_1 /TAXON_ID=265543 /ORGANISM="Minutocellus polymorphus, Strain NH13" /LENGTH=362 /DNA_ID=CAMNT_0023124385 /DNA_START=154 /DNA_END=1239 /DNA_ORIENTATION=-
MAVVAAVLAFCLLLSPLVVVVAAAASSDADGECCACETCHGFGEWVYGVGWLIPPYETEEIGTCLQRRPDVTPMYNGGNSSSGGTTNGLTGDASQDDGGASSNRMVVPGGQGDAVQESMKAIYADILEMGLRPGTANANNKNNNDGPGEEDASAVVARALNAALPGATAGNSEGLYYCVTAPTDEDESIPVAEAFYWVVNCNILMLGLSGNAVLCEDLTEEELGTGPTIGFVVDPHRTGSGGFLRYALFNESVALPTAVQPIEGATGFSCSARPWYEMGTTCEGPAKVLCPTAFEGTKGLGTFQVYGNASEGVVVSQDVATWQLCQCLDDLDCTASHVRRPRHLSLLGGIAIFMSPVVLVFV